MSTLRIQNLTAGYGKLQVIHDLDINIEEDDKIIAFTGPNGAGKSTLFRTILGLTSIFSGSIRLNGEEIVGLGPYEIAKRGITLVPQEHNIFSALSVRKNLEVSCFNQDKRSELLDYVYELFPILRSREEQRAESLSGGEKRMLAIGCGLMTGVDFLLVDEPCIGIQPSITNELRQKLASLDLKIGWIVLEDYEQVFDLADKCYILSNGQVTYRGNPEDAIREREAEKAIFGSI
jgi:ABC-type branched-subunit amino acid transport system ATPase component